MNRSKKLYNQNCFIGRIGNPVSLQPRLVFNIIHSPTSSLFSWTTVERKMNHRRGKQRECSLVWIILLLPLLISTVSSGEDFYDLLGIGRQANNREIRRAFKKLALEMHPDKNQDDPEASDKFIRINRAYEVLKDEDLRRKYDQFGEEGMDESNRGRNYENWHFYNQEFGLYDEDPEIITLSRNDFDPSVTYSEDIWFINFYSPRCSHCHDLAPS